MTDAATATLARIRLHLARSRDFPDGSARHAYEFVAPLNDEGRIDLERWKGQRAQCTVTRFWDNEPPESGQLVHRAGGADGATWVFDYDETTSDDDEAGYRFADHVFAPGDYVSLRGGDGETHTFKVFSVVPAI